MVIERIKELERKRQESIRRAELERQERERQKLLSEDNVRQQKQQEEREKQQREYQEISKKKEKNIKLIKESGIQDEMQKIGREFLRRIKHDVILDLDRGVVELVWGKYRKLGDVIDYTFWSGVKDYSCISAQFDAVTNSVSINKKKTIAQTDWNSNKNLLVEALAKAYLDPLHRKSEDSDHWTRRKPPSSSSGSSSSSECCCH